MITRHHPVARQEGSNKMAKEISQKDLDKVVKLLKKEGVGTLSETKVSAQTGIPMAQIGRILFAAEPLADPSLKIPATGPSIAKAREAGVRWPRIAARTGLSESKVKELFKDKTGLEPSKSYAGRGRNYAGQGSTSKSGTSGRRGAAPKPAAKPAGTSGRRGAAAKPATSGRRGARVADPK